MKTSLLQNTVNKSITEEKHDGTYSAQEAAKKEAEEASLKYLSDRVFFWMAVALQTAILLMTLFIRSIVAVFDFAGAFSACYVLFLFPGLFYLRACKLYGQAE